jgi:GT2 family glycosyltransferase
MWMNLVGMNEAVVRAEVFRQCGRFDSRFDPVEDYEMWLRASRRYGACYLDEPLAFIHSQRTSLTRQPELQERFRRNTLRVFHSELAVEQDPDMATMLRERIRAWWESEMGLALKEGQARRVVAICREAWRNGWRPDGHTRKIIRLASKMPRLATCLGRFC